MYCWIRWIVLATVCQLVALQPHYRTHLFYYTWYGTPNGNGQWLHWNHTLLKPDGGNDGPTPYRPPHIVASAYYPEGGPYSSLDREVIRRHLVQAENMHVGVLVVSWWGRQGGDGQLQEHFGGYTDRVLRALLEEATGTAVRVAVHIEPYEGRSAASVAEDIRYFIDLGHASLLRVDGDGNAVDEGGRPVFYVYDSYHTAAAEWAQYLAPDGEASLRGTPYDAVVLSLLVERTHVQDLIVPGHFDGFYTYFGTDGFSHGSTTYNWPHLQAAAEEHGLLFCPCVGPGYDDSALRPWNTRNSRPRADGAYYEHMWRAALKVQASFIGVTSWNEWGEGTQIEPAVPKRVEPSVVYSDYQPRSPEFYMDLTRKWSLAFQQRRQQKPLEQEL